MNEQDLREQEIERYVHGRMNASERAQFEVLMQHDARLRSQVNDEMELLALYDKDLISFKKKLDELQHGGNYFTSENESAEIGAVESPQTQPGRVISMKYVWAAVACIVLLIGTFWFFNRAPDTQLLAMNAAKNDFTYNRSELSSLDSFFAIGDYAAFISGALQQLKDSSSHKNMLNLKVDVARAYILSEKPQEALSFIQSLSEGEKKDCRVRYCHAVAELATKENDSAISLLNAIAIDKCYPYDDKATTLLNKLK
jgi:hypothetical protein